MNYIKSSEVPSESYGLCVFQGHRKPNGNTNLDGHKNRLKVKPEISTLPDQDISVSPAWPLALD